MIDMDRRELVPQTIRALPAYAPGKPLKQAELETGLRMEKMASNENPFGPSPAAIEAMREAVSRVHLYPDNNASELVTELAQRHRLQPEQVLLTCGSTQFLDIIARTLLRSGLNAVTSERSFIIYPIATGAAGANLIQVPMNNDTFDLEAILGAIDENTRIVFIANPNNPTGTLIDSTTMDRFVECVPENVTVVLDEAYYEFAEYFATLRGLQYTHSLDYVRANRNVVVLRTFSKAQGLAGQRIGYGFGPADLMQYFARVRTAFSVNEVAQAGALAALNDEAHVRRTVENNASGAALLTTRLSAMGLRVVPTWANFLFVEVGQKALEISAALQNKGVIVRPMGGLWGAPYAIRVTIGLPEQNEKFLKALDEVLRANLATAT